MPPFGSGLNGEGRNDNVLLFGCASPPPHASADAIDKPFFFAVERVIVIPEMTRRWGDFAARCTSSDGGFVGMLKSLQDVKVAYARDFGLFLLLAALWCVATWMLSGMFSWRRGMDVVERERRYAIVTAENIALNISQKLLHVRSVPIILSQDGGVVSVLEKFGPQVAKSALSAVENRTLWQGDAAIQGLTQRLDKLRDEIDLHTLFVLNAAGDCIAAGKPPESPNFIGMNYADRQYFIEAQKNNNGRQFAVGRTDNVGALFYAKPVLARGQFVGAVVSRINVKNLTNLVLDQEVFVTDENGVVILARDAGMLMKVLPGSRSLDSGSEVLEGVYKRKTFAELDFRPLPFGDAGDVVQWKTADHPFVHAQSSAKDELVTVHVLRNLGQISVINKERFLWFGLASLAGVLLLALVFGMIAYVRSISRHRRELLGLNENLARQAHTDVLTGCANRRCFLAMLEAERQRSLRQALPLSMLSLDIDHFKQVNDIYGHPGGDAVLRHLVSVVESVIRPTDRLGRVGGEEFGILLPHTTACDAASIAERVRAAVEESPAVYEQETIAFTVSIGVSQWILETQERVDEFICRCDKALYEAKDRGRNQVRADACCAPLDN